MWLLGLVEKEKETRKSREYYDTKNQRGLCQVKRCKGCERYRKWNRPWSHARNEADIKVKKTSNNMGLVESINDWKVRLKGGNKLRFYPKHLSSIFLYFIILVPEITKNVKVLQQMIEISIPGMLEYQIQSRTTQ